MGITFSQEQGEKVAQVLDLLLRGKKPTVTPESEQWLVIAGAWRAIVAKL